MGKRLLLSGWAWLALSSAALAQAPADSSLLASAVRAMRQHYTNALGSGAVLYTGPQYLNYAPATARGYQFFVSDKALPGGVYYAGYYFDSVPLQYDIRTDALITTAYNSPVKLVLVSEKVQYFVIDGHKFVRVETDPAAETAVTTGFYEEMVAGRTGLRLLAKHTKVMQNLVEQRNNYKVFVSQERYFIERQGTFYPVSSKGAVLAAIGDRKKELKKFASEQKLPFSKEKRGNSFARLVAYYDQLSPASQR